jgi:diamine N-acetyltransferase
MSQDILTLRALEPGDIDVLLNIENDKEFWKYSNQREPFSRHLLELYIAQQQHDIFEIKQRRYILTDSSQKLLGIIDLFDFEPFHRRVGVGLIIISSERRKGMGKKALGLIELHCINNLNIHSLYANIAFENDPSIAVFEFCGFENIGIKKEWNFYEGSFHDEFLYQKIIG